MRWDEEKRRGEIRKKRKKIQIEKGKMKNKYDEMRWGEKKGGNKKEKKKDPNRERKDEE